MRGTRITTPDQATDADETPGSIVVLLVLTILTAATSEAEKRHDADGCTGQCPQEPPTRDRTSCEA